MNAQWCDACTQDVRERSGAWNVTNRQFLRPRRIHTWAVVKFYDVPEPSLRHFLNVLCTNLNRLGKHESTSGR